MPQEKVSKTKTSIWAIKCPYCSTTFQDLRVHLVTDKVSPSTKSSSRVNCNYCDLVISNPTCMKRHEEKVHGGLYSGISCQECNIAFYDYNDINFRCVYLERKMIYLFNYEDWSINAYFDIL